MILQSPADELEFLRVLLRVHQMADLILEDCLERGMGLDAAADVFLGQCSRILQAEGGFVVLRGRREVVLERTCGTLDLAPRAAAELPSPAPLPNHRVLLSAALDIGKIELGRLGFVVSDAARIGVRRLQELIEAIAEQLDSSVLAFLAMKDRSPLDRLDGLGSKDAFEPQCRIGRHEIVAPLGTGGMAQVLVARSQGPKGVSRLVALKRILPHLAGDRMITEQFLDEARIGMRLSHPNHVVFHDFGEVDGAYFIVMELVRGVDLARLIHAARRLEPALASAILVPALRGLHAAHELTSEDGEPLRLVHRDLSPENLMVGFDGRVKLLDFGVAKAAFARSVTNPGFFKGKFAYMSPEQARRLPLDRRSDVFAMGVILYEALAGERPFWQEDPIELVEAVQHQAAPRHPRIEPAAWPVVERALAKNADERYASAAEMADALAAAVAPLAEAAVAARVRELGPERLAAIGAWERGLSPKASKRSHPDEVRTRVSAPPRSRGPRSRPGKT